jgi:hypothetical protein
MALTPQPPVAPPGPSATGQITPAGRPLGLRAGLRRLSTGLLVYAVIGLVLAVLGLLAMLYVGNRVGSLADTTGERIETVIGTVEDTATVLKDAGSTALSFANTLERTPPTVRQAAQTIEGVRQTLLTIETQLSQFSVLGSRPLGNVADQFGQIATDLEGLDTRLDLIASDLEDNRDKLLANSRSLTALGERLDTVADELASGFIEDGLDDVRVILTLLAFILVVWTAVPAIGALLLGTWLRRYAG